MNKTWVTDMRHYLDETGSLAATMPAPALNLALFLGSIVGWVTGRGADRAPRTNVPCPRSPGRLRCRGEIVADLEPAGAAITWHCPACGDNGVIRGWEDTRWDRGVD